jgi:uncharacterized protein (TIGR02145 family)
MFGVFKKVKFFCLLFLSLHNFVASSQVKDVGGFTTITIGNQVWLTKNLDVATFRNGDYIPQAKTNEEWEKAGENQQPAWCYYNNDPANGVKYGKLYNWFVVNDSRSISPVGYHIPSDAEWTKLEDFLGGATIAGSKMKSASGWSEFPGQSGNGTNVSGFSGLPGGCRSNLGTFLKIGEHGYWWSSSEYDPTFAWGRSLKDYNGNVGSGYGPGKEGGFSVRCVKD